MIEIGANPPLLKGFPNLNYHLSETLKGSLDDQTLKVTLAKFLYHNLGLTFWLVTGGLELLPFQELILRAWFVNNFNLNIWTRGGSKSTLAAFFGFMYPIFNPQTKIVLTSANFRSSRRIFEEVERYVKMPNAGLLRECFDLKGASHKNDQFIWKEFNEGLLTAVPLSSGHGLRGLRANVLMIDEFLLLSQQTIEEILKPFLVAKGDVQGQIKLIREEDELISQGILLEEDRESNRSKAKVIALTSASYKFEYCYQVYKDYISTIMDNKTKKNSRHFISQLSWEAIPKSILDKSIIEEAQNGGTSNAGFQREYGAQFTDDSEGYFKASKMKDCTIDDGNLPCIQIVGNKGSKYILAIDPSYSNEEKSDFFAMQVYTLDEENKIITLAHSYGVAGGDLKNHIKYLYYLLIRFNIVYLIIDGSSTDFIISANESELFKEKKINIQDIGVCFDVEGVEYDQEVLKARRQYRKEDRKIMYPQLPTNNTVRRMNESLQASIDYKKVWFPSHIAPNDNELSRAMTLDIPTDLLFKPDGSDEKQKLGKLDFIEQQDFWIDETKRQVSLIEVKSNPQGSQTFDLPSHLKNSKAKTRARKDHYTCLLLANWGAKCYFDIMSKPLQNTTQTFIPHFIG